MLCWKRSSNQRKTNCFPAKLLGKLSQNRQFFTNRFLTETGLENSCEIGRFFREFVPENPAKFFVFFPRPTRSPENLRKVLISQSRQLHWFKLPRESNPSRPFSSCCLPLCVETSVRAKPFIMKISSAYRFVYVNQTYFCKKGFTQTCFEIEAEAETTLKWPVGKNNFQDLQA